jgi:signal transduction histidine kinase
MSQARSETDTSPRAGDDPPVTIGVNHEVPSLVDEDKRIAREFGDKVIHHLFGAGLRLQALLPRAGEQVHEELSEIVAGLDDIISEIRTTVFGLDAHPSETTTTDVAAL